MYIKPTITGYTRAGQQVARRGDFLLLLQPDTNDGHKWPIRAAIRRVALRQLGHWMLGYANIGGRWYGISGAYGSDGLPRSVPMAAYLCGIEIPEGLQAAWNAGGGWNSAGSEAPAMRAWALENYDTLIGGATR